jgi:AcrR family transcriptional regulator
VSQREAAIYSAAVRLFRDKGYHATSVQDLADAVGLQKASLYHYIRGKEDLLLRLTRDAIAGHLEDLAAAEVSGGTGRQRLVRLLFAHVRRICANSDLLTVLLREAHALSPPAQEEVRRLSARYQHGLAGVVVDGVQDGSLTVADPALAALALLGAVNWIHRWYRPEGRLSPDEIAAGMIDLFLHGLAPAPSAREEEMQE